MAEFVTHNIEPWWPDNALILILGTMPSPESRKRHMYYGHPQNRFWPTLAALFGEEPPNNPEAAKAFCRHHQIALWDVLQSCTIDGASDATIADETPNDIPSRLEIGKIGHIFCTGRKAFDMLKKHWGDAITIPITRLPSPSAANRARYSDEALISAVQTIRTTLESLRMTSRKPFPTGLPLFEVRQTLEGEFIDTLYEDDAIRLERIESWNHSSPDKGFYDQDELEWVSVISGWAVLENDTGERQMLRTGDHCLLQPHQRHRVAETASPCIWICLYRKKTPSCN